MRFDSRLAPGQVLAERYRVERLLGQGGMSRVYLAADLKLRGKVWAVKECLTRPGEPLLVAREAELLISLNHHRLPRIVDFMDADQDGYSYIVMDFIEGVHLDRYVSAKAERLTVEELTRFGLQMLEGLQYLHNHQPPIVHRDVKPSNVLVDGKGQLRFVDFGIARMFAESKSEDTVQLGTLGFAAPEQYGGRQSDARADLYSLGAVLLYLGSGCRYSIWSQEAASAFRSQGYGPLLAIVSRLLKQNPEDRYSSAEMVITALQDAILHASDNLPEIHRRPKQATAAAHPLSGRTLVIAMLGVSSGVGTTSAAISLAHMLSRHFKRVALAEMDSKATAFQLLAGMSEEERLSARPSPSSMFRISRVVYTKPCTRSEFIELLTQGLDCVVCDLGAARSADLLEEFRRADLPIVVGSGAVWRSEELVRFIEGAKAVGKLPPDLRFCIPFAAPSILRRLGKLLHTKHIYGLPPELDPFEPGADSSAVFEMICSDLLPRLGGSARTTLQRIMYRVKLLD
ncbi:serine/threonine-protein kinase [Paenibacillus sanguinis]|uniref:serine/threonine-protein kinase n=1 Tax=Paenibacillus sanguinis TaxID=225906 RepID=UPI00037CC23C|nr:serine/threonine-protein kinase [Paenibacillus sanguinis]